MAALAFYILCMSVLCLGHFRRNPDCDSYFVCGRKAGLPMVTASLLASCIGGTATIGMVGLAWRTGWPAVWWLGSGVLGMSLLGLFLAAKIRATGCRTLPEIIALRLGARCGRAAAAIIVVSSIAIVAAQFNALGMLLASLTGLDPVLCIWTGAASLWLYTWMGGQQAVMKSDIWQFIVLLAALALALFLLLRLPPCAEALAAAPLRLRSQLMPPERALYFMLVFGSSFLIGPMLSGRLLSAATPGIARSAAFFCAIGLLLATALVVSIGISISGLNLTDVSQEEVLFSAMRAFFPPWANVAVILGLISAVASSADSCLFTAASIWTNDVIRQPTVEKTRRAISAMSLCSCLLVFCGKDILGLLLAASDIYSCGIVCPTLAALLRGGQGASGFYYAAMLLGGCCGALAAFTGAAAWSFTGFAVSAALSLLGAFAPRHKGISALCS